MPVQTDFTITSADDLANDIKLIDLGGTDSAAGANYSFTFALANGATTASLSSQLEAINLASKATLTINGEGDALNGGDVFNGFFVYSGSVTINDLTIEYARAVGGAGGDATWLAGGGGAGLGGGLFIGAGASATLDNVSFLGDAATGGAGGSVVGGDPSSGGFGGGGGLEGGAGGAWTFSSGGGGGGGGGIGLGAAGISGPITSLQSAPSGIVPDEPGGGYSGEGGSPGGGGSGGGGGGGVRGGGGGIGGHTPGFSNGDGGYGGGGGGNSPTYGYGGRGGFGGGGGGSNDKFDESNGHVYEDGGTGGFGGGGGGGRGRVTVGGGGSQDGGFTGGFGAGAGGGFDNRGAGGGGLGAGGDIFVQAGGNLTINGGSLGQASVNGGAGGTGETVNGVNTDGSSGEGLGSAIFFQGAQTLGMTSSVGQTVNVDGVIADMSGSGGSGIVGVSLSGGGLFKFSGANTYEGLTTVNGATSLELTASGSLKNSTVVLNGGTTLQIDGTSSAPIKEIDGFANGDKLFFAGIAPSQLQASLDGANATIDGILVTGVAGNLVDPAYDGGTLVEFGNGAPIITGTEAGQQTTQDQPVDPFQNVTIKDPGVGGTELLTISISGAGGELIGAGTPDLNGDYTLSGTAASITQELRQLIFMPTGGVGATSTTTLTLSDLSSGSHSGPVDDSITTVIDTDPTSPDVQLIGTTPGETETTSFEQPIFPFRGVSVYDPNVGADDVVTITVGGNDPGVLTIPGSYSGQDGTYQISGTTEAVNDELHSITYANNSGPIGLVQTSTLTLSLFSSAAPSLNIPPSVITVEDSDLAVPTIAGTVATQTTLDEAPINPFSGVTVTDPNNALNELTITVGSAENGWSIAPTATSGVFEVAGPDGLIGALTSAGSVIAPNELQLTGSAATVTQELQQITFTPSTAATTPFSLSDFSDGPNLTSEAAAVSVTDSDVPYVAGGTPNQTTQSETPIQPFAGATVTDPYNGDDYLQITVTGAGGTLTGAGPETSGYYLISGTAQAVTDALDALEFTPTAGPPNSTSTTNFALLDVSNAYQGLPASPDTIAVTDIDPGAPDSACYCRGARILTEHGEIAVEELAIGDLVVTASGQLRPVKWLGRRALDCRRHRDPRAVWPVGVAAGAFGEGRPCRDLWLSPGHNIVHGGELMPISALENGKNVVQHERENVEYWHVELDEHDIILAEGLPAESYLDTGNRTAFVNGGAFIEAHPDFEPKHWAETCLPLVSEGPGVVRAKALLLERLRDLGHVVTAQDDRHVLADGARIEPIELGGERFAFAIPAGSTDIRLMSRTFIPAQTRAEIKDRRSLGLCVKRLQVDGQEIALDDRSLKGAGWNDLEREPGIDDQRWTQGNTPMPGGTRLILVELAGRGYYWQELQATKTHALKLRLVVA